MRRAAVALAAALLIACGGGDEPDAGKPSRPVLPFTVRGRWEEPADISYRIEAAGSPVAAHTFRSAVEQALGAWERAAEGRDGTPLVAFSPAPAGAEADVTFGWRGDLARGAPDGFVGWCGVLAHTGPVHPGTFVHFYSGVEWSTDGRGGYGLLQAAVHEVGHVLGLGESPSPFAAMHARYDRAKTRPHADDVAGLRSLYGGPVGAGSLVVVPGDRDVGPSALGRVLRPAPDGRPPRIGTADTDGDGRDELLLWWEHPACLGGLTTFFFDARCRLVRTSGPRPGILPTGLPSFADRLASGGDPVVVLVTGDRRHRTFTFSAAGLPVVPWPAGRPLHLASGVADGDGDGRLDGGPGLAEFLERLADPRPETAGDLDGDGREDRVRPAGGGITR